MRRGLAGAILGVAFFVAGLTPAFAEQRLALVIGNSAYKHTGVLPNPKNDAKAVAEALQRLGFDGVSLKLDLGYEALRRAIRDFGQASKDADVAVVFFAGHGLEIAGKNYLVPTDAKLKSDRDVEFEAIKLDTVLRQVENARKLRLVILDACRNNPLGSKMTLTRGATRSVSRGLRSVEPDGDVLVAFAAKHGTVAEDGAGSNSPYTKALLKHLETPGLEINFLFRRVRDSVRKETSRRQEPFTYGSLGSEAVYLSPPTSDGQSTSKEDEVAALKARLFALEQLQKAKEEVVASLQTTASEDVSTSDADDTVTRSILSLDTVSGKREFKQNDVVRFAFKSNQKCHYNLINISSSGTATLLAPNGFHPEATIAAKAKSLLPAKSDDYDLKLRDVGTERVIMLCAQSQADLPATYKDTEDVFVEVDRAKVEALVSKIRKGKVKGVDVAELEFSVE
ncbi:MAG: caspase family protein [Methyloligellaceae bacterium]